MKMPHQYTPAQDTKSSNPNITATTWVLGALATMFAALLLGVGFTERGSGCGSAFRPDTFGAQIRDTLSGSLGGYADACDDALARARAYVIAYLVLTVLAVGIAAIVAASRHQRRITAAHYQQLRTGQTFNISGQALEAQHAGPTPVQRLGELTRLHQQGLVNDTEFNAKRIEILDQL